MGSKKEASFTREEDDDPKSRQSLTGGVNGSQNPPKLVTFGATPTLCVPDDASFGENNSVGLQTDTSRPLSSKDQFSRPSSSSRMSKMLEYEEELEERRRQRSAVLQSIGSNEKQRKLSANRITAAKRRREEEKRRQQKHHQVTQTIDIILRHLRSIFQWKSTRLSSRFRQ